MNIEYCSQLEWGIRSTNITKTVIFTLTGQYNAVLDSVVSNFMQKMSQLQHSKKRGLLDSFTTAFQGTVEQLKQVIDLFCNCKDKNAKHTVHENDLSLIYK